MPTFSEPIDWRPQVTEEVRTKKAVFGDGYEQEVPDGLNTLKDTWAVEFKQRTTAERDTIIGFFRTNAGLAFDWTPPNGTIGKYKCRNWGQSPESAGRWSVRATFERVYLP